VAWLRAAAKESLARRPHRDRDRQHRALGLPPQPYPCTACQAAQRGERRALERLRAALEDRETAGRYQLTHGLCVHHVLAMPAVTADGRLALLRQVLRARLGVLAWELAELDEKRAWSLRYDSVRTEAGAWLRALALLDGRIFGGGPAIPLDQISKASDSQRQQGERGGGAGEA